MKTDVFFTQSKSRIAMRIRRNLTTLAVFASLGTLVLASIATPAAAIVPTYKYVSQSWADPIQEIDLVQNGFPIIFNVSGKPVLVLCPAITMRSWDSPNGVVNFLLKPQDPTHPSRWWTGDIVYYKNGGRIEELVDVYINGDIGAKTGLYSSPPSFLYVNNYAVEQCSGIYCQDKYYIFPNWPGARPAEYLLFTPK